MMRALFLLIIAAVVSACATAPKPLKGTFSAVTPSQARQGAGTGEQVRWGGAVISVKPLEKQTCIRILGSRLGPVARPYGDPFEEGRFIACKSGFLDPAKFDRGQLVTVIGRVSGVKTEPVGDYNYRYPVLDTSTVYVWPEREDTRRYYAFHHHRPFFFDPLFWPYPYFYGYWFYPPYPP